MSFENWNPPAFSFGLAAVASVVGWREFCLHGAMMLLTFVTAAGTYQLARLWCGRPLLATLIALATPVFLVSATTLMCDLPMVACWTWSVVWWERALETGRRRQFLTAVLLAGLAVLTKYSAVTLLPLLPLLGLLRRQQLGWWLAWLGVPVLMICIYEIFTSQIYGEGLMSAAAGFAAQNRFNLPGGKILKSITGLIYMGGCLLPATLLAPFLWRGSQLFGGALIIGGVAMESVLAMPSTWLGAITPSENIHWLVLIQMILMMAGGLHLLFLAGVVVWRDRDTVAIILFLWTASVFIFAAVLNWTVSARSFLPLVAPAAILLVRALDWPRGLRPGKPWWLIPLAVCGLLSLGLTWADTQLANSGRTAARNLAAAFPPARQRLWFEGHCALQYYLEPLGGQEVDYVNSMLQPGDLLVIPNNNSNLAGPPEDSVTLLTNLTYLVFPWVTTDRAELGAGFYGAGGTLPYVFGPIPPEKYYIFQVTRPIQFLPSSHGRASAQVAKTESFAATGDEAILRDNPRDARTHAGLAEAASRLGDGLTARQHYEIALRLEPDQPIWLNNLAWLLATSPEARLRNGTEAVQRAERACTLTQYKTTEFIGTLGAAYAEAGRFADAMVAAQKACDNATARGETGQFQRNQELLLLYQSRQPYHETAEKLVPDAP